ncbi:MAG: G5 domain-containing protein [Firmicutes bacterium]|nr:G5 domain-containing protein [Bacillota bacterium]
MKKRFVDIGFIFLSCALIYGMNKYNKRDIIKTEIIKYDVVTTYDKSIPMDVKKVNKEGKDGKIVTNLTTGEVTVFESVTEEVTIGTGPKAEYAGMLTGYGPDCVGCTGLLYCPDSDGKYHYLTNDIESTYFYDKEYGKVRILASDPTLFPCGTIIHIVNNDLDIYGVCLDTGIAMRNAWRNYGSVLIDLAFTSESVTNVVTNRNTNFTVLRWGW